MIGDRRLFVSQTGMDQPGQALDLGNPLVSIPLSEKKTAISDGWRDQKVGVLAFSGFFKPAAASDVGLHRYRWSLLGYRSTRIRHFGCELRPSGRRRFGRTVP